GGLRVDGEPEFWFTARPWTTEQLDAARHRTDLGVVWAASAALPRQSAASPSRTADRSSSDANPA
ncbi:hypothetical protein ACWDRX_12830, partial [Streptomyces nigra]